MKYKIGETVKIDPNVINYEVDLTDYLKKKGKILDIIEAYDENFEDIYIVAFENGVFQLYEREIYR